MQFKFLALGALLVCSFQLSAQDDLLDMLGNDKVTNYATNSFKGTRVINAHSLEMLHPGTMDFRILHRFGKIDQGAYQLFGLDQASMRMGFDFGITKNLMAGFGSIDTAFAVRQAIEHLGKDLLARERPEPRYAKVESFSTAST